MDESCAMRLLQRLANLAQNMRHARGMHGSETVHHGLQVDAVEQFHHVVEGAFFRLAEIVKRDGVRRTEAGGDLRLTLEPPPHELLQPSRARMEHFRTD